MTSQSKLHMHMMRACLLHLFDLCALHCCCRLDIPKAPLLLGQLLGKAITQGTFGDDALQEVCQSIEDTEARRELLAHVFQTVQVCCAGCSLTVCLTARIKLFWVFRDTLSCADFLMFVLQKQSGDDAVKKLSTSSGLNISKLLQGDPEFDSQLESSKDFLSKQGLQFLSV